MAREPGNVCTSTLVRVEADSEAGAWPAQLAFVREHLEEIHPEAVVILPSA